MHLELTPIPVAIEDGTSVLQHPYTSTTQINE
jgi:hypothetical protein